MSISKATQSQYRPAISASGLVLKAWERYSHKKVALMISEIESAEEWNDGVMRVVMRSSNPHYIYGQISAVFSGIKKND